MEQPTDVNHPASRSHEWDIGTNYRSDRIWLWSTKEKSKSMTVFPMLNPASMGYGSVGVDITYKAKTRASRSIHGSFTLSRHSTAG